METTMLENICEISISYEPKIKRSQLPTVKTSKDCYQLLMESWNPKRINLMEDFKVLYMNRASRVLGIHHLSSGSIAGTVVDIRLIFATALKCLATKIIVCHNHPSGNLSPSNADISITQNIAEAGRFLQIELLDHLIISEDGYFSFSDKGYI
ncbi:JAB domain-containing protein [Niabella sp. CJ426]|uniref:JAB domain-containing protein n=1 Tax=Niabella sp. CJ426 TaxID=3393740 RepID=UPI003D006053